MFGMLCQKQKRSLVWCFWGIIIMGLLFPLLTTNVFAEGNIFKIQNVELTELSATVDGTIQSYDATGITSRVTFHKLDDTALYTITFRNDSDESYKIESITDDNTNPYVTYTYDSHAGEQIDAGGEFVLLITVKYVQAVADVDLRAQTSGVNLAIRYEGVENPDVVPVVPEPDDDTPSDEPGDDTEPDSHEEIPVPDTNDDSPSVPNTGGGFSLVNDKGEVNAVVATIIIMIVVGLIVCAVLIIKKQKRAAIVAMVFVTSASVAMVTTGVNAVTELIDNSTFSVNFGFYDKLVVTYKDADDVEHEMIVDYGEAAVLEAPEKVGHSFVGWRDASGNMYDETVPVTEDIVLEPVFEKNRYTIVFDGNGGEGSMSSISLEYDEAATLTSNSFIREDYDFVGWNTAADGMGDEYNDEQEVRNLVSESDGSITLYAIWQKTTFVCKVATELHIEPCSNSGSGGCANNGGYSSGQNIVYGTLVDGNSPKGGDAYDCDIDHDGVYDSVTERFYYLRSTNTGNAVMFYYTGLDNGTDHFYDEARALLPTTATWTNPHLVQFEDNRVARFVTIEDLSASCGGVDATANNSLLPCKFLLENTSFGSTANSRRSTYIVEREGDVFHRLHKNYRSVESLTNESDKHSVSRPTIEVPLNEVEGYEAAIGNGVVAFDITSDAVKNYDANVENWIGDRMVLIDRLKTNFDSHDCKITHIDTNTTPDFPSDYKYENGNTFCDRPKSYNTRINDEIKVYISDENTKEKGEEAEYVTVSNGSITNMIPGTTYYYESTTDATKRGYVKATGERRLISLINARNVRDIGGLTGADGRTIQYGRIMRGEMLSDVDINALKKLGITTEYDVRAEDGGYHFDGESFKRYATVNYNILPSETDAYNGVRVALTNFMQDIIAGKNIYLHCTLGSDRTGTMIYLIEGLLGVGDEDRIRDYELTSFSGRPDRTRYYDHSVQYVGGPSDTRKFVYLNDNLPTASAIREWYLYGSTDRDADEALITAFQNAVLE